MRRLPSPGTLLSVSKYPLAMVKVRVGPEEHAGLLGILSSGLQSGNACPLAAVGRLAKVPGCPAPKGCFLNSVTVIFKTNMITTGIVMLRQQRLCEFVLEVYREFNIVSINHNYAPKNTKQNTQVCVQQEFPASPKCTEYLKK